MLRRRGRARGIVAGREDRNDHDALRDERMFQRLAGRATGDVDQTGPHPPVRRLAQPARPTRLAAH